LPFNNSQHGWRYYVKIFNCFRKHFCLVKHLLNNFILFIQIWNNFIVRYIDFPWPCSNRSRNGMIYL
jgi:hypothetical protein